MNKVKKTYRLNQVTVEQIQILKRYYQDSQGLTLTDAQIVQKGIMLLMDTPNGRIEKYEIHNATDRSD